MELTGQMVREGKDVRICIGALRTCQSIFAGTHGNTGIFLSTSRLYCSNHNPSELEPADPCLYIQNTKRVSLVQSQRLRPTAEDFSIEKGSCKLLLNLNSAEL